MPDVSTNLKFSFANFSSIFSTFLVILQTMDNEVFFVECEWSKSMVKSK